MIRAIQSFKDAEVAIKELHDQMQTLLTKNIDMRQRRVVDAHPSIDQFDYVTRYELEQAITSVNKDIKVTGVTAVQDVRGIATWNLAKGGPLLIGADLANHFENRKKAGRFLLTVGNCKTPETPGTLPLIFDILKSTNQGTSWTTIFNSGDANKLNLSAGSTLRFSQVTFNSSNASIALGDWLRIDLLSGSNEGSRDIQVDLVWI